MTALLRRILFRDTLDDPRYRVADEPVEYPNDPEPDTPWWVVIDPNGDQHPHWSLPRRHVIAEALTGQPWRPTRLESAGSLTFVMVDDDEHATDNPFATALAYGTPHDRWIRGSVAVAGRTRVDGEFAGTIRRLTGDQAVEVTRTLGRLELRYAAALAQRS